MGRLTGPGHLVVRLAGCAAACLLAWAPAAASAPADTVRVLVVYHSDTGNTEAMARSVAEGVESVPGAVAALATVEAVTAEQLRAADAIALGSPTYYGNMSAAMKRFIDDWWAGDRVWLGDKVGGAFATGGGMSGGKELVVASLLQAMLGNGMVVVGPVFEDLDGARFGNAGATAVTAPPYEGVGPDEREAARELGRRLARVAGRFEGATP